MRNIIPVALLTLACLTGCATTPTAPKPPKSTAATAAAPVLESCGAFSPGTEELVMLPSLRVGRLEDDETFSLPADAPADASFIQCERTRLIPLPSDYKVLAAGHPLVIASGGRVAVLEISEARVNFRKLKGEFTDEEIPLVQDYLNRAQRLLDAANEA